MVLLFLVIAIYICFMGLFESFVYLFIDDKN